MAKRELIDEFKIMAPGGQATPAPPLGPVLGAKGVNPGQFIQQFNAATGQLNGKVVGCLVRVYSDRSFELEIKSSPASVLIKEAAGIPKGSGEPNTNKVGSITKEQVRKIADELGLSHRELAEVRSNYNEHRQVLRRLDPGADPSP